MGSRGLNALSRQWVGNNISRKGLVLGTSLCLCACGDGGGLCYGKNVRCLSGGDRTDVCGCGSVGWWRGGGLAV